MFEEATPLEALWQCVMSAHLKWVAEIEERLGVEIGVSHSGYGHVFAYSSIKGDLRERAMDEMGQCEDYLGDLYESLKILQGDPIKRGQGYRNSADLYGRTPWQALIDSGMLHVETVLIGPDHIAAAMLTAEPRLLTAARSRVLHSHDLDSFTPHVQQLVAHADSIIAAKAFEGVLNGLI